MEHAIQDANAAVEGIEDLPLHRRHVSKERRDSEASEEDEFGRQSPLRSIQVRDVNDPPQRGKAHDSFGDAGDANGEPIQESDGIFRNTMTDETKVLSRTNSGTEGEATVGSDGDIWQTIAGVAGNILEWYDFAVFGYLGDVIGGVFFPPNQGGDASTIEAFAVFGGAFLMRPIGGMLLGYIGDVYGRKRALVISIFLMAFPTFAMGCLPTYAQIGPFAIVLLTIVRLLQGLSVGGQLVSSLVFTLENHDPRQWGLYGSFVLAAANFGTLLGGLVATVLRDSLAQEQLESWGWRLPFISGIVVSFSGFYLRSHGDHEHAPTSHVPVDTDPEAEDHSGEDRFANNDTHARDLASSPPPVNPLRLAFAKGNRRALLASTMVPMLWAAGFYLSFVWMAIFMEDLIPVAVPNALAVNSTALFLSVCLFFPVAGALSDRFGRRRIMTIGGVGMGVLAPLLVMLIGRGHPLLALLSQLTIGVAVSFWGAPMCAWLVESFDPAARLTSVAIGYNLAQASVGGITPALATYMVDAAGPNSPGWILTFLALISLTGLWFVAPPPPPLFHAGLETAAHRNRDFVAVSTEAAASESEMVEMPKAGMEEHDLI